MVRGAFQRVAAILLASTSIASCSGSSPSGPAAPAPSTPQTPVAVRAAIDITSISVVGERASGGGYRYRVIVALRESAGVAARVDAVDLTFTKDTDVVAASRYEQPLEAGSSLAAHGTAVTRELVVTDVNPAHAYATSVAARIAYTDATDAPSSATGAADVPPLSDPVAILYSLTGVIVDQATGTGIAGARVDALNGINAGKAATTDQSGAYSLAGLTADGFRMRASASGFDPGEQNVTVPAISRADMALRRTAAPPSACAYSATPTSILGIPFTGGQGTITITQTTGTCGWQARSDASWLTLGSTGGSGGGTLVFTASPNGSFNGRTGVVTIDWTGGQARITVIQGTPPDFCQMVLTVGGQSTISVPASGGSYSGGVMIAPAVNPITCGMFSIASTTASPGVSIGAVPPGSLAVPFAVAPNTTGAVRSLFVEAAVQFSGTTSGTLRPRLTVNQQ